jgi:hypothetical protein
MSFLLVVLFAIQGCEQPPQPELFVEAVDLQELMVHVVEPAAEVYWDSVGTVMDAEGTHEIAPANVNEWIAVENAAATIAESGNLLLIPGRNLDDPRWAAFSQGLIAAGRTALTAADSRDPEAVFDAGGAVYMVCASCHEVFAPQLLPPNFAPAE